MINALRSSFLTVSINSLGAEICSVKNTNGLEFIWQADAEIWARHAPVLFPIVGKLKDNSFIFENNTYELPQHGFARDLEFELLEKNNSSCTFQLSSSGQSKKKYPFDFIFQINYRLDKNKLVTNYKIVNPANKIIYFSVGAHPGFKCPLLPDETFEDYYLEFESSSYKKTELRDGLLREEKKTFTVKDNKLFLSKHVFDNDALVFENSQVRSIRLCSSRSPHKIILTCNDWPYFGIWSKKNCSNFVCLEPWFGIADTENSNQQLDQKKGIIKLEARKEFNCSFSVIFE